jgi:FAD/FMN-containing dehydrogenase
MKSNRRKIGRRAALAALITVPPAIYVAYKGNELAAEPTGEKLVAPAAPVTPLETSPVQPSAQITWEQVGGLMNDASHINPTPIYGLARITSEDDVRAALQFARESGLKVAMAGVRHSMGGHAFARGAVVLDMLNLDRVTLNEAEQTITVQSGARWHDIQKILHPKYAVKAMQSSDIFSVGGSISVNAHGMDHQVGALGKTIRSLRLMLADGTVQTLSPTENAELFNLVVGGYGLFGVILEATLEITRNTIYETGRRYIDYQNFPQLWNEELAADKKLGLMYSHLSTSPDNFLREMILYTYTETEVAEAEIPPLEEVGSVGLRRLVLNFSKLGDIPMRLKWFAEKYIEPRMEACTVVSRNQAQASGEACLVSRNEPMHDSVPYLLNNLPNETDILHEYFVPRENFLAFVDGLRETLTANKANVLNASVRVVYAEENFLSYAPKDAFSIVLYINQRTDQAGHAQMEKLTSELIELTLKHQGRFFLPYQLYYTAEQLERSYPEIREFFAAKRRYDSDELFTNTFYEKYAGSFK